MTSADSPYASITGEMFLDAEMAAILSDRAWLQAMLDFEGALARAGSAAGVVPQEAADVIASACNAGLYDMTEIGKGSTLAGNPGGPVAKALTMRVARQDSAAAEFVHFGATSQDVIDSALGIIFNDAAALVLARLGGACHALAKLADAHRHTPMAGRTVMQQALPVPFGLKAANWLVPLVRSHDQLTAQSTQLLQFGGAAGTLAALGEDAYVVADALRTMLLADRAGRASRSFHVSTREADPKGMIPWHTDRSGLGRFAAELGILIASLGKIARDVMLMMQTEVGELFEPAAPGKGGSSTIPHKRNPVQSLAILACATRAPGLVATMLGAAVQEHERAAGGWQAEWDTMRQLLGLAGAASLHAQTMLEGLEIDAARMRANLEITGGLLMAERATFALAPLIGKTKAKAVMDAACMRAIAEKRHLRDILAATPACDGLNLPALFDPASYCGEANAFIDRILAYYKAEAAYMTRPSRRLDDRHEIGRDEARAAHQRAVDVRQRQ